MAKKIFSILSSVRFWIITFAWASAFLSGVQEHGFSYTEFLDQIAKWLGTVAGIGTLDKIAGMIRVKKEE